MKKQKSSILTSKRAVRELRTLVLFVSALLVFGIGCWFALPQVIKSVKAWLGRRHLAALRQSIQTHNWQAGANAMREARRMAPEDAVVTRACIDFLIRAHGDPRSIISLIKQLQDAGDSTPDDLALKGQMHLRIGEIAKARTLLEQLPAEALKHRQGLELQADILQRDGKNDQAATLRREALIHETNQPESLLKLASLDFASPDPLRRKAMHELLWQTARKNEETAILAIQILSNSKLLTSPEVSKLQQLLKTLTALPEQHNMARFDVLSAQMRLSPQLRAETLDQEIQRWKGRSIAEMTLLVAWLAKEQEYARILRMVPAQTAARYTDLLPHYINALRGEKKWQEMKQLLTSGSIDPSFSAQKIRLWLAISQANLDSDTTRLQQMLSRIFEEAGRGDDLVITLQAAELAEKHNLWDIAERCFQAIAAKHSQIRQAMLAKAYQMSDYQHDGMSMHKTCSKLLELNPESVTLLTQKLYLEMILGVELELADQRLQNFIPSASADIMDKFQLLCALSAYRKGLSAEMQKSVSKVSNPKALPVGERAVYASLLKLSGGDAGVIFRLVERISPKLLLPEEALFLRRSL